jgi:hypothetical protein
MRPYLWTIPNQSVKNLHKHAIIDLIRFTPGGISRGELARQLGLTRAAISTIVNIMLAEGILSEQERQIPGGRKPVILEIKPGQGYVIGVDMGATHVTFILADFGGKVIQEMYMPLDTCMKW